MFRCEMSVPWAERDDRTGRGLGLDRTHLRPLGAEPVPLAAARGRVLAAALPAAAAAGPLAAIDGFAVPPAEPRAPATTRRCPSPPPPIVAGAPLPPGADAVLPAHLVEAGAALAAGRARRRAAPAADRLAMAAGTILRPPHLALLARRGRAAVEVVRRPRVALRVAGPEIRRGRADADAAAPFSQAEGGRHATARPDLAIHAGRSGPGPDDDAIAAFETVFAHGVLIRPGETCALGAVAGIPALLLPGDPLACAAAFALLAAPALRRLGGRPDPAPASATLTRKIASGLGQVDAVPVRLDGGEATPLDGACARRRRRRRRAGAGRRGQRGLSGGRHASPSIPCHERRHPRRRPPKPVPRRGLPRGGRGPAAPPRSDAPARPGARRRSPKRAAGCWPRTWSPRSTCPASTAPAWTGSRSAPPTPQGPARRRPALLRLTADLLTPGVLPARRRRARRGQRDRHRRHAARAAPTPWSWSSTPSRRQMLRQPPSPCIARRRPAPSSPAPAPTSPVARRCCGGAAC